MSIDDSFKKLEIQVEVRGADWEESLVFDDKTVLIDPFKNIPLKTVYDIIHVIICHLVSYFSHVAIVPLSLFLSCNLFVKSQYVAATEDLPKLCDKKWRPPLRLTESELSVSRHRGSVLLVGRSGTGKTVCICDRMIQDRNSNEGTNTIRQLFLCKSKPLCEFVKRYVKQHCSMSSVDHDDMEFVMETSDELIQFLMKKSTEWGVAEPQEFPRDRFIDSHRFQLNIYPLIGEEVVKVCGMKEIVVWTQICSFIKGSIEAILQNAPLSLEQYMDFKIFPTNRCRLNENQRKNVYKVYKSYEAIMKAGGLWDEADRVTYLLRSSKLDPDRFKCTPDEMPYKVYVDEVQDHTQAEITLYLLLAGMNVDNLFLGGDPAQAVVEGIDFRFEEVRSAVYRLTEGRQTIAKPFKLLTNFRSHSGILSCAAQVLSIMFKHFPGSANELAGADVGLFKGPRPEYHMNKGSDKVGVVAVIDVLGSLLRKNERFVILTRDEHVSQIKSDYLKCIGMDRTTVMGIRESKGLEFQDIIIVDFFCTLSSMRDQKAFAQMLKVKKDEVPMDNHYPQLEGQLKLLYTCITRCSSRLVFLETKFSNAGEVFFRKFSDMELIQPLNISRLADIEAVFMTSDEWKARGIDFTLSACGENSESFLLKAVECFENARLEDLKLRAQCHIQLEIKRSLALRRVLVSDSSAVDADDSNISPFSLDVQSELSELIVKSLERGLLDQVKEICRLAAYHNGVLGMWSRRHFQREIAPSIDKLAQINKSL